MSSDQESSADSGVEINIKQRRKREIKITAEMEPHLDITGTHCLKCGTKTKDIESIISQVNSRKKTGGTRDIVKSKCAFCNTNKNKFVTKSKLEPVVEVEPVIVEPIVEVVKPKRGRKPKAVVVN